jgi:hypothetical protein
MKFKAFRKNNIVQLNCQDYFRIVLGNPKQVPPVCLSITGHVSPD